MNLSLDHQDMVDAVEDFVRNQGIRVEGKQMIINFACGRGANPASATVELISGDSIAAGPADGPTARTVAPVLYKEAPKTKEVEADEPVEDVTEVPDDTGGLFDD